MMLSLTTQEYGSSFISISGTFLLLIAGQENQKYDLLSWEENIF